MPLPNVSTFQVAWCLYTTARQHPLLLGDLCSAAQWQAASAAREGDLVER